jgi:serine/threonine-protein kinase
MATTELGACEWFVWDLRRSNLIDRGQLDNIVGEFLHRNPGAEPPALAEYLVGQEILTQFQAERLLQGKTQGFVLGPYTLMDALGTGSMGTVYKALSKTANKWYAVKVLPRRSMWNVRIARRKVRAFEQCRHPTVVPFVDVGTAGGMHYLAWPMVEGEPLEKIVPREGKLSPQQAARYILQVAQGMEVCHSQGLFHGLLKPSNIMIGPEDQVYILDLGIGSLLAETEGESLVDTMSSANSMASGLDCASPESILDPNNLTPIGDQYSLGCTLYFCLTGRYPFPDGTAVEKMMAHQTQDPEAISDLNPEVPAELAAVVERLMQKAPENRYGSTREVIAALEPFAGDIPTPIRRPGLAAPPAARSSNGARSQPPGAAKHDIPSPEPRTGPALADTTRHAPYQTPSDGSKAAPAPGQRRPANARGAPPARTPVMPTRESLDGMTAELPPPKSGWEERIGPFGIVVCAVLACAVAWLVAWGVF